MKKYENSCASLRNMKKTGLNKNKTKADVKRLKFSPERE